MGDRLTPQHHLGTTRVFSNRSQLSNPFATTSFSWIHFLRRLSTKSLTPSRIPASSPVLLSRNGGGNGANNAPLALVTSWFADIQSDPNGISSCVKYASFFDIKWSDPQLFSRVLENFNALTVLRIFETEVPDGMPEYISHGELSKSITALYLFSLLCSLSTTISMILAFPNLPNLDISALTKTSRKAPPAHPVLPQRRPLDSLQVAGCVDGVAQTLENLQFTSRKLVLNVHTPNIQKLLILSSATVAELVLIGACSSCVDRNSINNDLTDDQAHKSTSTYRLLDLPPFLALTSLGINIDGHFLRPTSSTPCLPFPQPQH